MQCRKPTNEYYAGLPLNKKNDALQYPVVGRRCFLWRNVQQYSSKKGVVP